MNSAYLASRTEFMLHNLCRCRLQFSVKNAIFEFYFILYIIIFFKFCVCCVFSWILRVWAEYFQGLFEISCWDNEMLVFIGFFQFPCLYLCYSFLCSQKHGFIVFNIRRELFFKTRYAPFPVSFMSVALLASIEVFILRYVSSSFSFVSCILLPCLSVLRFFFLNSTYSVHMQ